MNNMFDIKRFGLVLSKDFQEKWKKYALQFLTMLGIMIIAFIWFFYMDKGSSPREYTEQDNISLLTLASILFLLFGIVYSSTIMETMREKTHRIATLSAPASDFEKFFSRWLIVTVVYAVAFFIALWFADTIRVVYLLHKYPEIGVRFIDMGKLFCPEVTNDYSIYGKYMLQNVYVFYLWVSLFLLLQSLFVLGATFWHKNSFIKTFAIVAVIVFLYCFLNYHFIDFVFPGEKNDFSDAVNSLFGDSLSSNKTAPLFFTVFFTFFALFNWTIAFFRFRESEIINRM